MATWVYDQIEGGSRQDFGRASSRVTWHRAPAIHLLHTTEGSNWPGYVNGGNAPHFTINPRLRQTRQHFSLAAGSRALKPGGVDANAMGTVQYEIIGFAAETQNLTREDVAYIAHVLSVVTKATSIKTRFAARFGGGEGYGTNGPYRLTAAQFHAYEGILGHSNVPGNSHWDPGRFPIDRLIAAMGASTVANPVPPPTPVAVGLNTSGHSTAQVQAALNKFGHNLSVDGIYGTRTTIAARDFQHSHGLVADGIVGPLTWGALSKTPTTATLSKTRLAVDGIWGVMTTKAEQKALVGVTADGIRGPLTIAAEQRRTGARVDGIDGPDTRTHLQAYLGVNQDGIIGPITVRALQTRLNAGTF